VQAESVVAERMAAAGRPAPGLPPRARQRFQATLAADPSLAARMATDAELLRGTDPLPSSA
jgi:hypothetical protein